MLNQSTLKEFLKYDQENGIFVWLKQLSNTGKINHIAGTSTSEGYIQIRINRKSYMAHRLVWLYVYGEWPKNYIDHINGIKNDNRLINLRDVSQRINQQNIRKPRINNNCGLLGVYFDKQTKKYKSAVTLDGKNYHLGHFETAQEAHIAYISAKREIHFGCTL